jgi:hypothetical protein
MCVDCVLASLRIAQVYPGDEPLPEVILSQRCSPSVAQGGGVAMQGGNRCWEDMLEGVL